MRPHLLDVASIAEELGGQLVLDESVSMDVVVFGDTTFEPVGPVRVVGTLTNAGDGLVACGSIEAQLRTECSRCLEPFVLRLTADLDMLYVGEADARDLPEDVDREQLNPDLTIDLRPTVEAAVRLELPFAPVHDPECAGICPICGCDRNSETCGCETTERIAGPFDGLRTLLPEDAGSAEEDDPAGDR